MMSQERYANPAVNNRINVSPIGMKRLDRGPDITVLETRLSCSAVFLDDNVRHGPRQVVGPNHLVREEQRRVFG
jgi:hypothetical protein